MRRKLRLFYQNNKQKIWKTIGILILIYVIIQIANYSIKKDREENISENGIIEKAIKQNTSDLPSSSTSTITDSKVSEEDLKKDTELMENFIAMCNEGKVEEAYQLLSKDCKEELFPSVQDFYNNYYKDIFNEKKSYDFETWVNYGVVTYKVKLLPDIMSSGKVGNEYIEDYYTIIKEDKEKKLNIHNFIRKKSIEKKEKEQDLEIEVLNQYIYYDYEEYEVSFRNLGTKKIVIDTKEKTDTVFLKDTNGVTYDWYGNEVSNEKLVLEAGDNRTLRIKINKLYNPNRKDKSLVFTDINIEGNEEKIRAEVEI